MIGHRFEIENPDQQEALVTMCPAAHPDLVESRIRTCPGCGLSISAYTSGVLYPHLDLRGQPCQGCDDAADTDDQWILILREELDCDFAEIGDIYGLTPDGASKRYRGARRRENARVKRRGWA